MDIASEELMKTVVAVISVWGVRVVGALAVLIVGRGIAAWARRAMRRGLERAQIDVSLIPFLSSLTYYVLLAVVIIIVLNLFGIETTSLIAVLGAAGLAVGLAMQGTLSNVAAGVMLLMFRPFRLGDYVEVAGSAGTVAEIGLFSTVLNTIDNTQITAPNSAVFGQTIHNYTANATRRNDMVIGISYSDDIGRAIDTIMKVLGADDRVLREPAPVVAVSALGESSVDLVVRPWCRREDYWDLRFALLRGIKEGLDAAGVSIPFPQRDVHLHQ